MAQNSGVSTETNDCGEGQWTINNWNATHKAVVAAEASCYVEVGDPKVGLRFFLCPKKKFVNPIPANSRVLYKWYSLMVEILTQVNKNAAIKVTATVANAGSLLLQKDGTITLHKSKGRVVEVIDSFIHLESCNVNNNGEISNSYYNGFTQGKTVTDIKITINAQLFRLIENGTTFASLETDFGENLLAETEESIIHDLKNMFVAHQNYADLKLESKDHMTLDAHKFILAARSRHLAKCIDDAVKIENFNGTMKININGKPLVVILHWIYTGELHENSGNVMEEVVDAAILFELTHLMKVLDKKLITICNKDNMFRLYQVAQKNGMPNAMDAISVYIRENL